MILAIDPGFDKTAWLRFDGLTIHERGITPNAEMRPVLTAYRYDQPVIEMIASYGMPVGKEVFETCVWIGRFIEMLEEAERIFRRDVKLNLCGSTRAKDANVRQALLDRLGPQGTKKNPGPTYGISKDLWAALGVAVTAWDMGIK